MKGQNPLYRRAMLGYTQAVRAHERSQTVCRWLGVTDPRAVARETVALPRAHIKAAPTSRSTRRSCGRARSPHLEPQVIVPTFSRPLSFGSSAYPWKTSIDTTIFWVGENASLHNPVHNHSSSWDLNWETSYGGFDDPEPPPQPAILSRQTSFPGKTRFTSRSRTMT